MAERRDMAARHGIEVLDFSSDVAAELQEMTHRGPDSILDAVGMEAHGTAGAKVMQTATGLLPDNVAQKAMETISVDPTWVLHNAISAVRRGGTISLSGVYAGAATLMPLVEMLDKQIQ
ncbi:hypothetical protein IV500_14520 [Paeniglutamicibacter antarcticus]|uniref:Zinc-binding dehydrogenase n=1 Tax=Arthrobacter terrae TaxID=2935737 RepID=A0A931GBC3_9MICC|nr:hypothetical protein [Arthrobacter terrae]